MIGLSESRILKLELNEGGCPFIIDTEIIEITNPITGRVWMDRNIGASRAATSLYDADAYGHLFQWGRNTDGHQIRTSLVTTQRSADPCPGHDMFIAYAFSPYDWLYPSNDNLWQMSIDGWRIPTRTEWNEEMASWPSKTPDSAFNALRITKSGMRDRRNGNIVNLNNEAIYWTQTPYTNQAWAMYVTYWSTQTYYFGRATGGTIRLIKDI